MAKQKKKIVVLTADEAAKIKAKARGRAIFSDMLDKGQFASRTVQNKRAKAERKRVKKEDQNIKRGVFDD